MPNNDEIRLTSGFTVEERKRFRAKLDKFAQPGCERLWSPARSSGAGNPLLAAVYKRRAHKSQ